MQDGDRLEIRECTQASQTHQKPHFEHASPDAVKFLTPPADLAHPAFGEAPPANCMTGGRTLEADRSCLSPCCLRRIAVQCTPASCRDRSHRPQMVLWTTRSQARPH